jgi:hypothetical protein
VIPFKQADEAAIRDGAQRLAEGRDAGLPPRHLVSAAHYALERHRIAPQALAHRVIGQLTEHLRPERAAPPLRRVA